MQEYIGPVRWPIRTPSGQVSEFNLYYTERGEGEAVERFVVAIKGDPSDPVLLRVESSCVFGHILDGGKCDCGDQLRSAFDRIVENGSGIVIYALDEDARGHGVRAHFQMYVLRQRHDMNTEEVHDELDLPVDARTYSYVGPILAHFGFEEVVLMTNNPNRIGQIESQGIQVVERQPLEAPVTEYNEQLLRAERRELDYEVSYHDHNYWVEYLDGSTSSPRYLLVSDYRDVLSEGDLEELNPEKVPEGEQFLTVYVTTVPPIEAVEALGEVGLDKLVAVDADEKVLTEMETAANGVDIEVWS